MESFSQISLPVLCKCLGSMILRQAGSHLDSISFLNSSLTQGKTLFNEDGRTCVRKGLLKFD